MNEMEKIKCPYCGKDICADGRMSRDEATVIELHGLLVQANRRRKSAERTVRKMRGTIRLINDSAMTSISSRQRTIEEQWEVMRELQRRGLVSTEDLEAVLKDVMHVAVISMAVRG